MSGAHGGDVITAEAAGKTSRFSLDPISILALLCIIVVAISIFGASAGWQAIDLRTGESIRVESLTSDQNIRRFLSQMPQTFFGFPPLGMVVMLLLGAGMAEKVGLIGAALHAALAHVPTRLLTPAIALIGILAHVGSDAAYFIAIPFAGYAFASVGRNPLAGVCAAFAAVGGGYGANLLVTPTDVAVYGLTEAAARIVNPSITINILANYYMLAMFAIVVIALVTVLTDYVIEPRLNREWPAAANADKASVATNQARGLRSSLLAVALVLAGGAALGLIPGGPLRGDDGGLQPFYRSFVAIVALALVAGAIVFGIANRVIRTDGDAYRFMREALADTAPFLLLVLFAAHFSAFLEWSHLAEVAAANGAIWLRSINLTGGPLILIFCLLTAVLTLVLPSTSAKWALMAPTAVPMMMALGVSPEMTAAAYRFGSSATELVTPTALTPIALLFAQRYAPQMGFGRFIGLMVPYMTGILGASLLLLATWIAFDLPLGPTGARVFLTAATS